MDENDFEQSKNQRKGQKCGSIYGLYVFILYIKIIIDKYLSSAANVTIECLCKCGSPSPFIFPVPMCSSCTETFCIEKQSCNITSDHKSWHISCFQRGSYKDEFIVSSFLIFVVILLVLALSKPLLQTYNGFGERHAWTRHVYDSLDD